ncbi:MAG: hypothetical protein RAP03_01870 [Candidatus Electryonea clarkiae]|nr:hypothetical protein [Candidatus Electryonea clarkiae]
MNHKPFILYGWALEVIGVTLGFTQNYAYGRHDFPTTTPEAIVTAICFMIVLLGYVMIVVGKSLKK